MKKKLGAILLVVALLVTLGVGGTAALAYKEGPSTNWYYLDAQYISWHNSGTLTIEINTNPADGQVFPVGDTITITCDVHPVAVMCGGAHNEAYTDAKLSVTGPSGPDSNREEFYEYEPVSCAVVDNDITLTITYNLTDPGTHTVYMYSYAAVAWGGVDIDEDYLDALLTFEVVENFVTGGGKINGSRKADWTFGGTVGFDLDGNPVGQFQIVDHQSKVAYHLNSFSSLSFSDTDAPAESPVATYDTATFTGSGNDNAGNAVTFTVIIQDLGEPGAGVDNISVTGPASFGLQVIDGGNFQVHDIE